MRLRPRLRLWPELRLRPAECRRRLRPGMHVRSGLRLHAAIQLPIRLEQKRGKGRVSRETRPLPLSVGIFGAGRLAAALPARRFAFGGVFAGLAAREHFEIAERSDHELDDVLGLTLVIVV